MVAATPAGQVESPYCVDVFTRDHRFIESIDCADCFGATYPRCRGHVADPGAGAHSSFDGSDIERRSLAFVTSDQTRTRSRHNARRDKTDLLVDKIRQQVVEQICGWFDITIDKRNKGCCHLTKPCIACSRRSALRVLADDAGSIRHNECERRSIINHDDRRVARKCGHECAQRITINRGDDVRRNHHSDVRRVKRVWPRERMYRTGVE